ncbi:MAG: SMP-30/gluconolactonase/LRE family protein [Opitutaceae bacterium]|nr:SMP-30/gluconolactonase/LRE family protein [Opitutaceae bacterium]
MLAAVGRAATEPAETERALGPLKDSGLRIIAVDSRFKDLIDVRSTITRHQTGSRWSEGPAWNAAGRYLVWSDVPNSRQWRWLEEDGHVSEFRHPSNHTNGATYDAVGRMLTCEQTGHQVVRHEPDGSTTVLADQIDGVPFNSPNDIVVHPDGGIWFTDPGYGVPKPLPQKEAIYRIDGQTGTVKRVDDALVKPNGLCFSPDFKKLYVADTGPEKQEDKALHVYDVTAAGGLANRRKFAAIKYNGLIAGPDGQQVDAQGNLWASSGHGVEGINGVHVFSPGGDLLGVILLPETCANVCFGGSARDRLFMTATTSLYSVQTLTHAAHGS